MRVLPIESQSDHTSLPSCDYRKAATSKPPVSADPLKSADDGRGSASRLARFVDFLRLTIGRKPLYLAERWAEAKVRQEEAAVEAKLLAARAEAEKTVLDAWGQYERNLAEADFERSRAELNRVAATRLLQQGRSAGENHLGAVLDVTQAVTVAPKQVLD
jgi:hypothetical protein